jgi:hypothetical protein
MNRPAQAGQYPGLLDRAGTAKTEHFNHPYRNDRVAMPVHSGPRCRPRLV